MSIDWEKIKQNAKEKDDRQYAAMKASAQKARAAASKGTQAAAPAPARPGDVVDSMTGTVIRVDKPSRLGYMGKGAAAGSAAGATNAAGLALSGIAEVNRAHSQAAQELRKAQEGAAHYRAMVQNAGTEAERRKFQSLLNREKRKITAFKDGADEAPEVRSVSGAAEKVYRTADTLQESSRKNIETAKEGLGAVGQFGVDLGVAGLQMAGDAVTGGLPAMFLRSAGSAAQEARQSGASFGQQAA